MTATSVDFFLWTESSIDKVFCFTKQCAMYNILCNIFHAAYEKDFVVQWIITVCMEFHNIIHLNREIMWVCRSVSSVPCCCKTWLFSISCVNDIYKWESIKNEL